MDQYAQWIGYAVMLAFGGLVSAALLFFPLMILVRMGTQAYASLATTYSATVVHYWLDRLEKEGTHTFERARRPSPPTEKESHV